MNRIALSLIVLLCAAPILAMEKESNNAPRNTSHITSKTIFDDEEDFSFLNDNDQHDTFIPTTFYFAKPSIISTSKDEDDEPYLIHGHASSYRALAKTTFAQTLGCSITDQNGYQVYRRFDTCGIGALSKFMDLEDLPQIEDAPTISPALAAVQRMITTNTLDWKRVKELIDLLDHSPSQMPKIEDVD